MMSKMIKHTTLIIKTWNNSFEKYINNRIQECDDGQKIDVISFEELLPNRYCSLVECIKYAMKNKWRNTLKKYGRIIVFDYNGLSIIPALFLAKRYDAKLYVWEWNILDHPIKWPIKLLTKIYTFDPGDAKRYNLKFARQFYFPIKDTSITNPKDMNLAFFVGMDKGRKELVEKIKTILERNSVICDFRVIGSSENQQKFIDYRSILCYVQQSTVLVDIVKTGQTGMTIRVMEAVFFNKKLISNNKALRDTDIFHPSRILIISDATSDSDIDYMVRVFLMNDMKPYTVDEQMKYSFHNWIANFV